MRTTGTKRFKTKDIIAISAIAIVTIGTLMAVYSWYRTSGGGVNVQVPSFNLQQTDNGLLGLTTQRWVASGTVQNQGSLTSNTIQLHLSVIAADTGAILYTTDVNPTPSTLGAGETGTFTIPFTSEDLGGYKDSIKADIKVTSQ
jgi:hypothetical protein